MCREPDGKYETGLRLFQLQKAHVERRVVRYQDGIFGKLEKERQHLLDRRLAFEHVWRNSMNARRLWRYRPPWVDQLLENFLLQQPAIDNSHGPIETISSPSDGRRPVVSVSKTVYVSSVKRRWSISGVCPGW